MDTMLSHIDSKKADIIIDLHISSEHKELLLALKEQGITRLDLMELSKLSPEDLAELMSALAKISKDNANRSNSEAAKNRRDAAKERERQRLEREQARKLNQMDEDTRKTLNREAMSMLSTDELELLNGIDAELRNKLMRLHPK